MALKLKGSTSGFVAIDAPSVAGNNTLILPENTGSAHQILANDITAGVTTFTQVTVNRNGDLTVPGTISIGGTLTYEDVTSVDSVGIVTARSGVRINGGGLTIIGDTTGLNVASGISTFQGISLSGNTSGLNVTGVGTFANGSISLTSGGAERLNIASPGGGHVLIKNPTSAYLAFGTNDTERLRIDNNGKVLIATTTTSEAHANQDELIIGSSSDDANHGLTIVTPNDHYGTVAFSDGSGGTSQGLLEYNHSGDYMRIYTAASERLRIDSSGRLLINTTTNRNKYFNGTYTGQLQVEGTTDSTRLSQFIFNSNSAAQPFIILGKSRGTSTGSYTVVQDDDFLGAISFQGADGDEMVDGARIEAQVNGTPSNDNMPTDLVFKTNTGDASPTERLRITEFGRVIIGTTNDTSHTFGYSWNPKLQLESNASADYCRFSLVYNGNDGVGPGLVFGKSRGTSIGSNTVVQDGDQIGGLYFQAADGTDKNSRTATIVCYSQGSSSGNDTPGRLEFSTTSDGASDTTERLRIASDGEVTFKNKGGGTLKIGAVEAHHSKLVVADNGGTGNGNLTIEGGDGSDFVKIGSNGDVLISDAISLNTNAKLAVASSGINPRVFEAHSTHASFQGITLQSVGSRNTTNGSYRHFQCVINGVADKMRVEDSGNVTNSNNSYGSISDERLKENIVDASSQWDDIKALRIRKFNFKSLTDPDQKTMLGVVAQEAELVCPGLVTSSVTLQEGVEQEYKSFKYSILYMKAIKCLQEAQAKIETLEAKVAALEGS